MLFYVLKGIQYNCRITSATFHFTVRKQINNNVNGIGLITSTPKVFGGGQLCPAPFKRPYATAMAKPRIYVTKTLCSEAIEILNSSCDVTTWSGEGPVPRDELMKNISNVQGLYCTLSDKIDKAVLDQGKDLKVVATMSVGYDHLDIDEMIKRGIRIGYTPGVLTDATAELTMALLLATSRRLFEANSEAKNGGWKAWSPFWMCGPGLKDSTVGVVGFGKIGQDVARKIKPFNPKKILYYNRSERPEAQDIGAEKVAFDELLTQSDFVVVTIALTPATKHLFNDAAFKKMKKTAVFVNTSRGDIVDQKALVNALSEKTIWAAGLDVMTPEPLPTDNELFKLDNCVILPHIGSACIQTRIQMAVLTANNIVTGLQGREMPSELVL